MLYMLSLECTLKKKKAGVKLEHICDAILLQELLLALKFNFQFIYFSFRLFPLRINSIINFSNLCLKCNQKLNFPSAISHRLEIKFKSSFLVRQYGAKKHS